MKDVVNNDNNYNMVASINHIGHVMGLQTITKFVENQEIQSMLEDIGVDFIQGYVVDKPHPIDSVMAGKQTVQLLSHEG